MGLLGIDGIRVLIRVLVFGMNGISFRSFSSDSRINRMNGIQFTRNTQNTRSFGKFLAGNPTRPPAPVP